MKQIGSKIMKLKGNIHLRSSATLPIRFNSKETDTFSLFFFITEWYKYLDITYIHMYMITCMKDNIFT